MIKVSIYGDKVINRIEIKGHANYDEYGKDIVCASVSSIVSTSVNGILRLNGAITYKEEEGYLLITINKHDKVVDGLIDNMIDLLKQLEKQYKNNIKIGRCHQ